MGRGIAVQDKKARQKLSDQIQAHTVGGPSISMLTNLHSNQILLEKIVNLLIATKTKLKKLKIRLGLMTQKMHTLELQLKVKAN